METTYKSWYEINGQWENVSSFCWEQEERIIALMQKLGIEFHIKNDWSIEDKGFNLWVPSPQHRTALIACMMLEGWTQEAAESFAA